MIERIDNDTNTTRGVIRDGLLYFGGHVANGKDITEQTKNLLARYDELLEKHGSDKHHLLSATVYITDISLRDEMNKVWYDWIPDNEAPIRACIEVGLPEQFLLEITIVAELIKK